MAEVSGDEAILSFIFGRSGEIRQVPPPSPGTTAATAEPPLPPPSPFAAEERRARALADAGELPQALAALDAVVRASELAGAGGGADADADAGVRIEALNDRAQVRRLLGDDAAALADLDRAVALGERRGARAAAVLAQALTQRSVLRAKRGNCDADAAADLRRAAELGQPLAQRAVGGNAMATLCRDTVSLMLKAGGGGEGGKM